MSSGREVDINTVIAAVSDFRQAPTDDSETNARRARMTLARTFLTASTEKLIWFGQHPARQLFMDTLGCGLRTLPLDDRELTLLETARRKLAQEDAIARIAGQAAFCLLLPAHALPRRCDLAAVPAELLPLALVPLFCEPEFFIAFGEAERHAAFMRELTADILTVLRGASPLAFRRELAEQATALGNFKMNYFNDDCLRETFENRARIVEFRHESAGLKIDHVFPPRVDGRRVRVGVLRPSWDAGTETAAAFAHLNGLDRGRFELFFYAGKAVASPTEASARRRADHFAILPEAIADAAARIRADDLDLMLIGTNVIHSPNFMFFLAAFRLARVQAALTLSPATTGLRSTDYYLNGAANEPEDAQQDYTEKLLLVPGCINRYDFGGEAMPEVDISRQQFGAEDNTFVYISGASFYKIVPELLDAWARILGATPGSHLLLYPFNPNWAEAYPVTLFQRHVRGFMRRRGIEPWRFGLIRPQPSRAHIHAVLRRCDLYLDSFPFSGAVSIMDPIEAGCPILAYRGRPARSRQSAALLAELDGNVVTATVEDYVAEAIRLHGDRPRMAELRRGAAGNRARLAALDRLELAPHLLRIVDPDTHGPRADMALQARRASAG